MERATKVRLTIAGALLAGTMAFSAGQASAMPALDHGLANTQGAQTEQVRWICGPWGPLRVAPGPLLGWLWLLPSASLGLGRRLGLAPSSPLVVTA